MRACVHVGQQMDSAASDYGPVFILTYITCLHS